MRARLQQGAGGWRQAGCQNSVSRGEAGGRAVGAKASRQAGRQAGKAGSPPTATILASSTDTNFLPAGGCPVSLSPPPPASALSLSPSHTTSPSPLRPPPSPAHALSAGGDSTLRGES